MHPCKIWDIYLYDSCHTYLMSYKSCKVKYRQCCWLCCKLQPIIVHHIRLCSVWDHPTMWHLNSVSECSQLFEVATALCSVAERSSATWRKATLGHTAAIQPFPPPSRGRRCVVLCPVTRNHQELAHGWCPFYLAGLLWAWDWVWLLLLCRSPMLRPLSIFKLICTSCTHLADARAK